MKGKQKLNTVLGTIIFAIIVLVTNKSNAALQSNGDTPAKKNIGTWLLEVRKMQTSGETLGLSDTINTTNLTSNNTNLDIHMEKNTEYGAMALLSASAYGKPDKINDGETTTGNKSGIYMNINKEWVAATVNNVFSGYADRYKNIYNKSYSAKIGDAMTETSEWHGSINKWATNYDVNMGIARAFSKGIFSYWSTYAYSYGSANPFNGGTDTRAVFSSRAVIVNGSNV